MTGDDLPPRHQQVTNLLAGTTQVVCKGQLVHARRARDLRGHSNDPAPTGNIVICRLPGRRIPRRPPERHREIRHSTVATLLSNRSTSTGRPVPSSTVGRTETSTSSSAEPNPHQSPKPKRSVAAARGRRSESPRTIQIRSGRARAAQ